MRTYLFYILLSFLLVGTAMLAIIRPGSVGDASKEIITLIAILSAAVMSCIFSVSKNINLAERKQDKQAIFWVSNYWIRFFCICAFCAFVTILGKLLSWPEIVIMKQSFDWIGFLSMFSLSFLFVMIFIDFPTAIRDILYIENEIIVDSSSEFNVPSFKSDKKRGKLKTSRAKG